MPDVISSRMQELQVCPADRGEAIVSHYKIAVVIGSLRRDSFNRKLAAGLAKLAPPEFSLQEVEIGDVPLYNQDDDASQASSVKRLKAEIAASQGLLFVTPEYNRSIPGVLKNAIDNASRPYGQSAWAGKPAGVIGISIGAVGTAVAQQHLRTILAYLDVPTLGQPEAFIQYPSKGWAVRGRWQHRRDKPEVSPGLDGPVCRVDKTARRLSWTIAQCTFLLPW
jgi:chromate reductase, NAD(P)H dehydrogenase (quinone)